MLFSVVICTHNPRESYLNRVLGALREQTFSGEDWEIIIVDNASSTPVRSLVNLTWKANARVVEEPALGVANARLRGMAESAGDVIVFVDDDNILAPDYLAVAARIAAEHQKLGAWGGQCFGEFETPPPAESSIYLGNLAVRSFTGDTWGNHLQDVPPGAGLCFRRVVAQKYMAIVAVDPRHSQLGQVGEKFGRCEDTDIALTSYDLGLGLGFFADLSLIHIIPPWRLEQAYLSRLIETSSYSRTMLDLIREGRPKEKKRSWRRAIFDGILLIYQRWFTEPDTRRYLKGKRKGMARARRDFDRLSQSSNGPTASS